MNRERQSYLIRNLLFDLDGTLVDSSETVCAALAFALERAGLAPPEPAVVRSFIGRPLLEIFSEDFDMDPAATATAITHYRNRYRELGRDGSRLYDHVEECLAELGRAGFALYVATVKPDMIAERVLGDFGLRAHFRGVCGSSMDGSRRHKVDVIGHALGSNALMPSASLMIGDRAEDVFGARTHGLDTIGAAYGYGGAEELAAAGALHVASGFDEVAELVLGELSSGRQGAMQ